MLILEFMSREKEVNRQKIPHPIGHRGQWRRHILNNWDFHTVYQVYESRFEHSISQT